jgi:hypothetical protein
VQNLQNKVKGMVSQNTTVIFEGAFYLGWRQHVSALANIRPFWIPHLRNTGDSSTQDALATSWTTSPLTWHTNIHEVHHITPCLARRLKKLQQVAYSLHFFRTVFALLSCKCFMSTNLRCTVCKYFYVTTIIELLVMLHRL